MARQATWLDPMAAERGRMVDRQLAGRGIRDPRVLEAMRRVPRELFIGRGLEELAYADSPLPIAQEQTISQPYVVALMVEAAAIEPGDKVLEIGTGSGYGAAVLGRIVARLYTIERHRELAEAARQRLASLDYRNIEVRHGDGTLGWPEAAPFDAIIVTAGGPEIPEILRDQLEPGGRMVIPVGTLAHEQRLVKVVRDGAHDFREEDLGPVRFVPLIGARGWVDRGAAKTEAPAPAARTRAAEPLPSETRAGVPETYPFG
jgi:protein-L-isoaspartate(D-aspartate) O-methyltransferase